MNKKFSTLMASLLLAGGVLSFASASTPLKEGIHQVINTPAEKLDGGYYFFVQNDQYAYGFKPVPEKKGQVTGSTIAITSDEMLTREEFDYYLWSVQEIELQDKTDPNAPAKYGYVLTNKGTGKRLIFDGVDTDGVPTTFEDFTLDLNEEGDDGIDKTNAKSYIYFKKNASQTYLKYDANGNAAAPGVLTKGVIFLNGNEMVLSNGTDNKFNFYKYVNEEMDFGDLDELYNSVGFNFEIPGEDEVVNLFAQEGVPVKALTVNKDVHKSTAEDEYGFPSGIYFVTETPEDYGSWSNVPEDQWYDYLLKCTFIAIDPATNGMNAGDRASGKGFELTEVSGYDLIKYMGDENSNDWSKNDEVSVYNACFKVYRNEAGAFSVNVKEKFRYLAKATDSEQKAFFVEDSGEVSLGIVNESDDHNHVLATSPTGKEGSYKFTFKFTEMNAVNPISLLNEKGKAAVYTMQFVGNENLDGKYLYAPAYQVHNQDVLYAKGAAFIDRMMPETQFTITKVDGNNITFTNRANHEITFTAKLFSKGNNTYTLALPKNDANEMFHNIDVNNAGDMEVNPFVWNLHNLVVKLESVEPEKFYGTWNVEDGTQVTMWFARDDAYTSNKLYIFRPNDANDYDLHVTPTQAEALQFQLVKEKDSTVITLPYVYKVSDTQTSTFSKGDSLAYYTYRMQSYRDGALQNAYLTYSGNQYKLINKFIDTRFIIKDNVDGSVSIIEVEDKDAYNSNKQIVINKWDNEWWKSDDFVKFYEKEIVVKGAMKQDLKANNVKTYLTVEAAEESLDANTTYVNLSSHLGNYITMNDERDAIVSSSEPMTLRLFATDTKKVTPSFYITTGWNENDHSRMFLFNPEDSVNYNVATGQYDKVYQWNEGLNKALFKQAAFYGNSLDTIVTNVKGKQAVVAVNADNNKKVLGGLDRFKFQIVKAEDEDNLYNIRQNGYYLVNINGQLAFTTKYDRKLAMKVAVDNTTAPTANEEISANNVVVAGVDGAVVVKGAEGKNVIVSTILGKVVANEVVSSDNATIAAPAGIVVVSVDGESFKVVVK